ncbi:GNAT family [Colletotrichum musicola]|uniref:GNAT family n=1 Tax=Colletotrichum musicola TaxID=2175873 RepID=A0A8H6JYB1_9PEZI|nr:GNAT family [Colletotrichum musicola]
MTIRQATLDDVPVLLNIITSALPRDYQWQYCFRQSSKQDPSKYVRSALEQTLAPGNNDWLVCVAEEPNTHKPVGLAIWSWTDATIREDADEQSVNGSSKDDTVEGAALHVEGFANGTAKGTSHASNTRIAALGDAVADCRKRQLARYGKQLHLHVVATHPDHQRKGYAKLLCHHGITLARSKGMAASAVASSLGYIFFSGLGFVDCGQVVVRAPGEGEEIELKSMVYATPQQEQRRGSWLDMIGLGERRRSSTDHRLSVS